MFCEKEFIKEHCIFNDLRFRGHLKTSIFDDTPYMLHTSQFTVDNVLYVLYNGEKSVYYD